MIVPSAMNMKFKFPEFKNLDDGVIEFAIEEAVITCGSKPISKHGGWIDEANQTLAMMYYAAHVLRVSIMRAQSASGQIIASETTPELSITYANTAQASTETQMSDLGTTPYGIRFRELVQKNFPAVLTVGSAVRM